MSLKFQQGEQMDIRFNEGPEVKEGYAHAMDGQDWLLVEEMGSHELFWLHRDSVEPHPAFDDWCEWYLGGKPIGSAPKRKRWWHKIMVRR
jgi:hypothetical protein